MAKFLEIYNFNNLFHQNEFLVGNIKCYDIKFNRYKKIRDCDKDQMDDRFNLNVFNCLFKTIFFIYLYGFIRGYIIYFFGYCFYNIDIFKFNFKQNKYPKISKFQRRHLQLC